MNGNVIEVRELTVGESVHGVSFTVGKGEIYALLGNHGAGKTTVLEAVAGYREPAKGTVRVRGIDPYGQGEAVRMGTVWQEGGLFPGLTVAEVVDTWRRWTLDPLTRDDALRLVGLAALAEVPFERLSAGERRRLDLALALIGRSDVLFLDEPTIGLDSATGREVWTTLRFLAAHGVTVLVSTRNPDEASRAGRMGVLDEGRLVAAREPISAARHAA